MKKILLLALLSMFYTSTFAIANPASVKCEQDGGKLSIIKDISGNENGVCSFSNGNKCDEWAYFRGECSSDGVIVAPISIKDIGSVQICTMEYAPVCAEVQVQCIKAPCNPVQETFGNKCSMNANKNAKFLYNGECGAKDTSDIPVIVGGDKDEHGCIGSAGYSWFEDSQKCERSWERNDLMSSQIKRNKNNYELKQDTDSAIIRISYPMLSNIKMDDKVNAYVKEKVDNFMKDLPTEKFSGGGKYFLNINGELKKIGSITTYKLTIYGHIGGPHGYTTIKTYNFLRNGTELVLKNKNLLSKISKYTTSYFLDLLDKGDLGSDKEWVKSGLLADSKNYSNWLITGLDKENLKITFIFDQYQIASYADGIKELEINLTKLNK